jgi:hypothetical protein
VLTAWVEFLDDDYRAICQLAD